MVALCNWNSVVGQFEKTGPLAVSASSDSLANRAPLGRRSSRSDESSPQTVPLPGIPGDWLPGKEKKRMIPLLKLAIEAHGGLERWHQVHGIDLKLTIGGGFWQLKGLPQGLVDV